MAVSFIGAVANNRGFGNVLTLPVAAQVGDFVLMYAEVVNAPTGWTRIATNTLASTSGPGVFWRRLTSTDALAVPAWAMLAVYRGVSNPPINAAQGNRPRFETTAGSAYTVTGLTSSGAGMAVYLYANRFGGVTAPAGWSLLAGFAAPDTPTRRVYQQPVTDNLAASSWTSLEGGSTWDQVLILRGITPPLAATKTFPANGAYADIASEGFLFDWVHEDDGPGDVQTAYAFRRKQTAATAYEWWDAATSTWTAEAEVWNPSLSTSVAFPAGAWVNGVTWQWSVATRDTEGLTGPYGPDFLVVGSHHPQVTINGPAGTVVDTDRPVTSLTYFDLDGDPPSTVQVRVFTQQIASERGFRPESGSAVWDSGRIAWRADGLVPITITLPNTSDYVVYAQVWQVGDLPSAWASSPFRIDIAPPAVPALSAHYDPGTARAIVEVRSRDNLLSATDASFETGGNGWTATGGVPAFVAGPTVVGARSLRITADGLVDAVLTSPPVPVSQLDGAVAGGIAHILTTATAVVELVFTDSAGVVTGTAVLASSSGATGDPGRWDNVNAVWDDPASPWPGPDPATLAAPAYQTEYDTTY
jgi:hypothetical protein